MSFPTGNPQHAMQTILACSPVSSFDNFGIAVSNGETYRVDCAMWQVLASSLSSSTVPIWFGAQPANTTTDTWIATGVGFNVYARGTGAAPALLRIWADGASGQTTPLLLSEYVLSTGVSTAITHARFPTGYARIEIVNVGTSGIQFSDCTLTISAIGV